MNIECLCKAGNIFEMFYSFFRNNQHADYAKKMAALFKCPTDDSIKLIKCLRDVHPVALTESQWKMHDYFPKNPAKLPLSTFLPRIDKEAIAPFMPESGLNLVKTGDFENLPWMVGLTSQEGAWYVSTLYGQDNMTFLKEYDQNIIDHTQSLVMDLFEGDKVIFLIII